MEPRVYEYGTAPLDGVMNTNVIDTSRRKVVVGLAAPPVLRYSYVRNDAISITDDGHTIKFSDAPDYAD